MIGCIITGHGEFAKGMMDSLTMITGEHENFKVLMFQETDSLVEYEERVKTAILDFNQTMDGVLIFSDLLGGTPFKTAMIQAQGFENVAVLTGTNLAMLVELSILSQGEEDVEKLALQAIEVGKFGMQYVKQPKATSIQVEEEGDGI